MRDYDWGFGFGFGPHHPAYRRRRPEPGGGYGSGGARGAWYPAARGGGSAPGGYDRGLYGDAYPGFGGVPGGDEPGMYRGSGRPGPQPSDQYRYRHLRDDEELEHAVRQKLYQDDWIDADAIEVEVNDAVVTLRGEVDDYLEARFAWDDAWETDGVRGVVDRLVVRAGSPGGAPGDRSAAEPGG